MATHLDLQEQEQLDELKAFWKQYGSLITWVLIIALAGFGGWNAWNTWQASQAAKAGALYDLLDSAQQAGDLERTNRAFDDLKDRFPGTAYAEQGGLAAAKVQAEKGQADAALKTLAWVADNASQDEYRNVAHLRAAGVLLELKRYDDALKQVEAVKAPTFQALADDRRGDVLVAQGKKDDARKAYQASWKALEPTLEYRRLVEAKMTALGVAPEAATPAAAASGVAS